MKKIFLIFIMSLQVFAYDTYFEADYSSVNDNEAGYKTKYIDITVEAGKEISFDLGGHWDWWIDVAMCHRKGETNYGLCGYPDGKDGLKENQGNSKYQTEENVHYDPNDLDIVFTPGKHRVIIQVLRDDFQTKDRFFLYRVNAIKPVISNHKPTAYRKRPTSQSVTLNVNESMTFEVRGTDVDGDIDYARISSSGQDTETDDCQYDCSEQTAYETYSWDTAGSYTVQGYVEDKNGVSDSVTWNIKVIDPSSNYKFSTKEIKEFSDTQKLRLQIYSNSIFTASLKIIDLLIADSARKNNSYQYFHKYRTDFVDNTINSIEGLSILNKLSKNKKIGLDEGLYIASNTISLLIDGLTEEGSDTNTFLSEASSTMFDLYGCLPIPEIGKKADFKSCGKVILLPADLIKRGLTTNDIIENNKIINSIYIALASVRYTIKFNRTLNDINNLDYDSEISNIINNIELINTSNLVNLFSSDLDDREKTIHYIKEFHKLLFSVKYQELLNTTLKDENKQSYNNKPMKPSILIKSSKSPLKPKISLTNYYDSDNDKLLAVWIDIRKVSDNKYLFDSGWMKETTIEIPLGYLEYNTKYKIRARFKDEAGKLSDVSYKEFVINSNINNAKVKFISPDGKPEIVEFGDVKIGECATKKVTITKTNNQGSVNGNVKILTYDNSYVYSLKGENGFNLSNKGDTKEFEIEFCPSEEKTSTSYIQAYTNKDVEFEPSWKAIILKGSGVENGGGSNGNSNSNNNNVVNDENTTKEDFYITNYSLSQNKFIVGDNTLYVNSKLCYRGDNPNNAQATIAYYLSKDNILDKNDIVIETDSLGFWRENKLCVNENNRLHLNNIQKGTYYIITALDYNHETKESDENNNIASEKITITDDISNGNDFYISNFSVSKEEMKPYEIFDMNLNIAYNGSSTSILSPKVKIYLSSDKNIDTSDTFLFRISSGIKLSDSQKTYYYSDKLRIPDNTSIGNYYLIAEVNYDNKYNENNKENNIKYIPIKIINNLNIDTDNDGISDADEKKYGLNPLDPTDANQDIDGDGVSNIDEIRAGTDLNDNSDYSRGNQTRYMKVAWFLNGQNRQIIPKGIKGKIVGLFTWWGDHSIIVDLNNNGTIDYNFDENSFQKKDVSSETLNLKFNNGFSLQDYKSWTDYWEDPTHGQINCWDTNSDGTCKYQPNGVGATFYIEDNKFECKNNIWRYRGKLVNNEEIYCIEYENKVSNDGTKNNISKEILANLYFATIGRTMSSAGLDYWTNTDSYDGKEGRPKGTDITTIEGISASFAEQIEYKKLYPDGTSNEEFVNQIFQNLFQRDAASSWWADEITAGHTTRTNAVLSIIYGAKGDDAKILKNRATVAIDLAENYNISTEVAKNKDVINALKSVTSDSASIDKIKNSILFFINF